MNDWIDSIKAAAEGERAIKKAELQALGYVELRLLPTGKWAAISNMLFTTGLLVGLTSTGYERRFCYEKWIDACSALHSWDGNGDPPGPWIKEKPSDRLGPGAL